MVLTLLLASGLALAAGNSASLYLPGAGATEPRTVHATTGLLWYRTTTPWAGLLVQGEVDLGRRFAIEGMAAAGGSTRLDTFSLNRVGVRFQAVTTDRFRLAPYLTAGTVGWQGDVATWWLPGVALEAGSEASFVDLSMAMPISFLWTDAPEDMLLAELALMELGWNLRVAPSHTLRVAKTLTGGTLSWRWRGGTFHTGVSLGVAAMVDDRVTTLGQAQVGARF